MRARAWAAVVATLVAGGWGAAGYLTTKPTDFHDYRRVAVQAAQSTLHAVATTRMVGSAASQDRLWSPYVSSVLDDARDAFAGAAKKMAGETPPDERTTAMRDELTPLMSTADERMTEAEEAIDAEDATALRRAVDALAPVAEALSIFIEEHR
ncbi:hypothetical protein GA0070622_2806 [Micromonospora sediminicola]|uniref:Uncharacterized protein n=1 Tax=Micromonospora sediminicola TaxID=946078 RepID=A0A1A9B9Z2_9ACTN|nr:hypothetical protein [Micromonospora sediminicola]SBT65794.1 hypothetical protein GA0070622_2806 [Micromonospora sediminicola]